MRMVSAIAWYPACRWKPGLTPGTAGANGRDYASARLKLDGADAALPTDFHTMARAHRCVDGYVHIDPEWAIVHIRSCRHTRRGGRRIRRRGMDHHGSNRGPDARHDPGRLDGRHLRPTTCIDRRVHRICGHFLADPVLTEPVHVTNDAVLGRPGHRILHPAH